MPNFVFLYNHGVALVEEGGSYLLFLTDKDRADKTLEMTDQSAYLRYKDSLIAIVTSINNRKNAENSRIADASNRKIVTAYMSGVTSKRSDPTLVRDIKKWSNNETTTVYIIDANYTVHRNYRGEVLNKNITAIIRYHLNGKCYIQWRSFGYEALGGGNFSKDMETYNNTDYFIQATGAGGSLRLEESVAYEIDCN
jgi:hypothetical protein